MFQELRGKRVLITGASTGIGAAVARAFGQLGARVAVHYHASGEAAEQVVADIRRSGGEAVPVHGDVADASAVTAVVDQAASAFDGLDVLINNAGAMLGRVLTGEIENQHYDHVMDLNARSVVTAVRVALPHFLDAGGGCIINTSSIAARNGGGPGAGVYAASKGFVSTLTRALAKDYAAYNIRVNAVAPGTIYTPFHQRDSSEAQLEAARKSIPLGRLGTAEDCVGAYLFLATEGLSGYITGQVIEVNGGQLMP